MSSSKNCFHMCSAVSFTCSLITTLLKTCSVQAQLASVLLFRCSLWPAIWSQLVFETAVRVVSLNHALIIIHHYTCKSFLQFTELKMPMIQTSAYLYLGKQSPQRWGFESISKFFNGKSISRNTTILTLSPTVLFKQNLLVHGLDHSSQQGPNLLKNFGGDNPYCLRFETSPCSLNRSTTCKIGKTRGTLWN